MWKKIGNGCFLALIYIYFGNKKSVKIRSVLLWGFTMDGKHGL